MLVRSAGNARVHLLATLLVITMGVCLRVASAEWCFLILAIGLVWTAEAANTAIELLGDRVSRDHDELIGRAKDLAAAAVLLAATAAAVIGLLVLGPRLWALLP